jgi:DNA-binding MarR family transcriptional regulator
MSRPPARPTAPADPDEVAGALQVSVGLLVRRLRQVKVEGDLTLSENSALARLDRSGPMTAAELARLDQVTPQSMGAIVGVLETKGLVVRRRDPADGRRAVISATPSGHAVLRSRRGAKVARMAEVLAAHFEPAELERLRGAAALLERLAEHL